MCGDVTSSNNPVTKNTSVSITHLTLHNLNSESKSCFQNNKFWVTYETIVVGTQIENKYFDRLNNRNNTIQFSIKPITYSYITNIWRQSSMGGNIDIIWIF